MKIIDMGFCGSISARGLEESVLRSTAPAPLGVRKVHKIVYNIASIFNFGLALRALAAVERKTVLYARLLFNTRIRSQMFTQPSQDILMPPAIVDLSNPLAGIDPQKPISIIFIKIASQAK